MKNKKGFTLVELLAVIAILAILVIIALPNVMGMFNSAKKNSFETEVKNIFKSAEQEWIMDSMMGTGEIIYSRCSTCSGKSLDLTGRSELEYYIKLNKSGKVVEYYVTDGTYQYSYNGNGLAIEDIKNVQTIASLEESQIITMPEGKQICVLDMVGAVGSERHFFPYKENVTWDEYYDQADSSIKQELDQIWYYHRQELKTNIITSKCFLRDGGTEYACYSNAIHKNGPYTDSDFENINFYGYRDTWESILDSDKVCYTYID